VDDEGRLIDEALEGSDDAFCRLVRIHQGRVRTFLIRYVHRPDLVDDLAQEVFLTAYHSLRTFKKDAPLGVWLLGIARHQALRHLRDEGRRRARESGRLQAILAAFQADEAERGVADETAFEREMAALQDCLKDLPGESSQIVTEHYFQGRSLVSLAGAMGRKEGTLRVALLRIRASLRRCVQGKLSVEGAG
jgi:RNA polymerase sigma-70 factor, ECF subfamily